MNAAQVFLFFLKQKGNDKNPERQRYIESGKLFNLKFLQLEEILAQEE